ncbi:MAG: hypothetical protein HDKAJFGB_04223 [Anaerolineae bacterium]|nr:hypothetical protein [Anaerolineae bacterium]
MFATSAAVLLALLFFVSFTRSASALDPKCGLLPDCTFDDFYGNEGACSALWKCDNPSGVGLTEHEGWPKGPSLTFAGDAPFDRKVFQRVAVTPGKGYRFSCPFCVVNINGQGWHDGDQVNRRLGIDPFGGTDPNSPNIKWSNDFFTKGRFEDDVLQVSEYARADHITVFIWVSNPYGDKHVDVFVDTPSLVEDSGMPPIQVTQPTVTPPPPPPTEAPVVKPTRVPPTDAPAPTLEPTAAPADEPTAEPTVAPTDAPTVRPTRKVAQLEPTARPTRVRSAPAASSAQPSAPPALLNNVGIFAVVGCVGIAGALILVGAALFLLLRRK